MRVFIIREYDYIDENDKSLEDVLSLIFPRDMWDTVTNWLSKQKCAFWLEKNNFNFIEDYLFKGYEHIYIRESTTPKKLLEKYSIKDSLDIDEFFREAEEISPTDEQIDRRANWPKGEEHYKILQEYREFMKRQLCLPFKKEEK